MPVDKNDKSVLKRSISNWNKTANIIYNTSDPDYVYKLLMTEMETYKRPYNIERLYQRFCALRRTQERKDIESLVKGLRYTGAELKGISNVVLAGIHLAKCDTDLHLIRRALKAELATKNRPYMINKIYGFFQTKRQQIERKELSIDGK